MLCRAVFDRSVLVSNGFIHEALLKQTEPATSQLLSQGIDLSQWFVPKVRGSAAAAAATAAAATAAAAAWTAAAAPCKTMHHGVARRH